MDDDEDGPVVFELLPGADPSPPTAVIIHVLVCSYPSAQGSVNQVDDIRCVCVLVRSCGCMCVMPGRWLWIAALLQSGG